jgi:hypothetical protein
MDTNCDQALQSLVWKVFGVGRRHLQHSRGPQSTGRVVAVNLENREHSHHSTRCTTLSPSPSFPPPLPSPVSRPTHWQPSHHLHSSADTRAPRSTWDTCRRADRAAKPASPDA